MFKRLIKAILIKWHQQELKNLEQERNRFGSCVWIDAEIYVAKNRLLALSA